MSAATTAMENTAEIASAPPSRVKRILRWSAWIGGTLAFLLIFTILKLPKAKIQSYVRGIVTQAFAQQGITLNSSLSEFSLFPTIRYTLKEVRVRFNEGPNELLLDEVRVSPKIIPFLTGAVAADLLVKSGKGELTASVSMKNPDMSVDFDAENLDLTQMQALPALASLQGGAVISGEGNFSGNMTSPDTLEGDIQIGIKSLALDSQAIYGIMLPPISIAESMIKIKASGGTLRLLNVEVGKQGAKTDDITAKITGDIKLGKQIMASTLDIGAEFSFSEKVSKAIILLEALVGSGKQPDGTYAFRITGTPMQPIPVPGKRSP